MKVLENYFQNMNDQGNSNSDPSQILILQFPIPRASLPPSLMDQTRYPSKSRLFDRRFSFKVR